MKEKKSFFERLTGTVHLDEDDGLEEAIELDAVQDAGVSDASNVGIPNTQEDVAEEGQLTVDVYQTDEDITIQTMVAGVKLDDLTVSISRDVVTIKGRRERTGHVPANQYFYNELYWGSFARTILLPEEIIPEEAEATEHHGLLTLRLPKIDKKRQIHLKVKSV